MKRIPAILLMIVLAASSSIAQDTYYMLFSYDGFVPEVSINDRSAPLQQSLCPKLYQERSVQSDMQWVQGHDSALATFWLEKGDTLLHVLRELSGIEWRETDFDIYLVRYYPSLGASDPLIIPLGGMGDGFATEAAPTGARLQLNLIYQLAHRLLAQAIQPDRMVHLGIAYHPLMRPGPYRLDNLAWLLALNTAQHVIGIDSTFDAFGSAFWHNHKPERIVFDKYFLTPRLLTPDQTLADWLAAEPYNSEVVQATRPPRPAQFSPTPAATVAGLPPAGYLGFSVEVDESSRLFIKQIDTTRLAWACGLRRGDRIYRVDGRRPRTHLELVEKILEGLDRTGSATVEIIREDQSATCVIQPQGRAEEEYLPGPWLWPGSDTTDNMQSPSPQGP
ncbi:MAG: PDZ domain-containing protein [bacterium]